MITGENLDRRFWIGASDTKMVMAKHSTKQWADWWAVKMGWIESQWSGFSNIYTIAGDMYEKPIARYFGEEIVEDRTILLPEYSLRVNLDADVPKGKKKIIECKTYKAENGKLDVRSQSYRAYYMQMQVQLFAWEMIQKCVSIICRKKITRLQGWDMLWNSTLIGLTESLFSTTGHG